MCKIYKMYFFFLLTATFSVLHAIEIPKPIQDWVTVAANCRSMDMQIKSTTFPSINSKEPAVLTNMHYIKSDLFVKIVMDTLDIIQSSDVYLKIDKKNKIIYKNKITAQDRVLLKTTTSVESILQMLNMYDTVFVSAHSNTSSVYTFSGKNIPFYSKCELEIEDKTQLTKRCTFYYTDQTYYEKTEIFYEKISYDVPIPKNIIALENYIDLKKNKGERDYKQYNVIEN